MNCGLFIRTHFKPSSDEDEDAILVILFYKDASLVIFFYKDVMWVYSFKAGKMQGNSFFFLKVLFFNLFILSYISDLFVFFSNAEDFLQFAFDSVFSNVLQVFMKISFSLRHQWLSFLPKY